MMAVGVYAILTTVFNILYFKKMTKVKQISENPDSPLVSVIIPARDEENSLGRLLDSLINQSYQNIEILVINDQSSDRTQQIIEEYEKKDSRIHGYKTQEGLRLNKHGKINALLQLIPYAKGDYLLATDADTAHATTSVAHTLSIMQEHKLDIVSGFPTELCESYWGSINMSSMLFANIMIPHFLIYKLQFSPLCFAIGQYIMMRKDAYYEVGGYNCIKNTIVDDMGIVRLFVKKKKKYAFINMSEEVACYMYHERKEAFRGIERSITGVFPAKWWILLLMIPAISVLFALAWSPVAIIVYAIMGYFNVWELLLFIGWLLFEIAWFMGSRNINFRKLVSISGSFSMTAICIMYLHGLYRKISGKNFIWKGRVI